MKAAYAHKEHQFLTPAIVANKAKSLLIGAEVDIPTWFKNKSDELIFWHAATSLGVCESMYKSQGLEWDKEAYQTLIKEAKEIFLKETPIKS